MSLVQIFLNEVLGFVSIGVCGPSRCCAFLRVVCFSCFAFFCLAFPLLVFCVCFLVSRFMCLFSFRRSEPTEWHSACRFRGYESSQWHMGAPPWQLALVRAPLKLKRRRKPIFSKEGSRVFFPWPPGMQEAQKKAAEFFFPMATGKPSFTAAWDHSC